MNDIQLRLNCLKVSVRYLRIKFLTPAKGRFQNYWSAPDLLNHKPERKIITNLDCQNFSARNDPKPFIVAMENFSNEGGMISEQLWDADDLPGRHARRGFPTGAAMPLCWSHAEYVSLVRSAHDGACFDRVKPAFERYVVNPVRNAYEFWSFRHPVRQMFHGRILRLVVLAEAAIVWSADRWASTHRTNCTNNHTLDLWFADLPTENCPVGAVIEFTFFWKEAQRWEGGNKSVVVTDESDHALARRNPQ